MWLHAVVESVAVIILFSPSDNCIGCSVCIDWVVYSGGQVAGKSYINGGGIAMMLMLATAQ